MNQLLQPIPSTAGLYAADATGQIWRVKGYRVPNDRKVRPYTTNNGYRRVHLCIKGATFRCSVHRLVAEAFHGKCPEGLVVCHANHVRTDNRPDNLHYGTQSENCLESVRDKRYVNGRKGMFKLKAHQHLEIIARYAGGAYQEDIAEEYGVSQSMVSVIISTRLSR